jgi:hypothetical protein
MRSPLRVCADPARKCNGLDDASTSHSKVGLCPMHRLLCTACPACNVILLNAMLWVHGTLFIRSPFFQQTPVERSERVARCWAVRAQANPLSLGA